MNAVEDRMMIRVRINLSHTLKEGWRLSETTVEATGTIIDYESMQNDLEAAYEYGHKEAVRRNRMDKNVTGGGE